MSNLDIFREDEAGITSPEYQTRTADAVGAILAHFAGSPYPKTAHVRLADIGEEKIPLTIRVQHDPPSVQVIQEPQGGVHAGKNRVRKKLHSSGFIEHVYGDDTPIVAPWRHFSMLDLGNFITVERTDLTSEIIALTVGDPKTRTIIKNGLLTPEQMAELLELLRLGHPHLLVIVKRHLFGLEHEIGLRGTKEPAQEPVNIPYTVVGESDIDTFRFLEELPEKLAA